MAEWPAAPTETTPRARLRAKSRALRNQEMARCVADRGAAGFADDRGFAARNARPAVEWDHVRNHHCIRRAHCVSSGIRHGPVTSKGSLGGTATFVTRLVGTTYSLVPSSKDCHLESFVCPRRFATLSDDGSGMGRSETTYQHSQARRRLRRNGQSIRRPILEVEGPPPRLRRNKIPGFGRSSGTDNPRRLYLARASPPYHQSQKGESR
jgi:hypothetical protein